MRQQAEARQRRKAESDEAEPARRAQRAITQAC
jgi:hypothetical protein